MRTKINSVAELQEGRQYVAAFPSGDVQIECRKAQKEVYWSVVQSPFLLAGQLLEFGIDIFDVTPEPEPEVLLEWVDADSDKCRLMSNGRIQYFYKREEKWEGIVGGPTPIAQEIIRLRERVKELEGK